MYTSCLGLCASASPSGKLGNNSPCFRRLDELMHVRHLGPCLALWKYKIDTQVEMLGAGRTPQAGLSPRPPAGPSGAFCAPSQPSVPAPATARGAAREPRATELSGRQGRDPIGWVGLTEAEGKGPAPLPLRLLRGHNLRVSQLFYWLPLPPGAAPWGLWHFPTQYFPGPRGSGLEGVLGKKHLEEL